jgi:hypothetical protein
MACVEKTSGQRFTNMHRLSARQHKSIPGHRGFTRPGTVVVSHAGQPSVGTNGPTLAQVSALGATQTQVKTGG